MWVVKLGGSLASDPGPLREWLGAVTAHGAGRVILVPGGGLYADRVREDQSREGFDDGEAHWRAIGAMEQFGEMLARIAPPLTPAGSAQEIRRVLGRGGIALWRPSAMVLGNPGIPETWDVTSDSLAAWVARELGAEGLVLVKSCAVPEGEPEAEDLARQGVVDPAFPEFARGARYRLVLVHKARHRVLRELLARG